ncbi:hypothetical protein [Microcoleus sp. S13_C5]|uniref:hypothetical protein n=1 Tax=Microcoleus sp. S13_C5 TaxID=3055411 RepID=UPI002FD6A41A
MDVVTIGLLLSVRTISVKCFLGDVKVVQAGFLAIDCYAKTGNPPSAGYVNNSYCS